MPLPAAPWVSVAWSPKLAKFAAVSSTGVVATSPTGVTWTDQSVNVGLWADIAWGTTSASGVFAGIGNGAIVLTSTNGTSWSHPAAPTGKWLSLAWSKPLALFCAIGQTSESVAGGVVMTSTDGSTWVQGDLTVGSGVPWSAITWSAETAQFLAVSLVPTSTGSKSVITSPDGLTWTLQPALATLGRWTSVVWSPVLGLFAAVGSDYLTNLTPLIATSPDGVTWTFRTCPTGTWTKVIWAGHYFLAVSSTGTSMVSSDGLTWALIPTPAAVNTWKGLVWAPDINTIVAVGDTTTATQVMIGTEAADWIPEQIPSDGLTGSNEVSWNALLWTGTQFVGVGACLNSSNTARTMTSTDGVTWTRADDVGRGFWYGLASNGSRLVAVSNGNGSFMVMTSDDGGLTWSGQSATTRGWRAVAWSADLSLFVAVGMDTTDTTPIHGYAMSSADGITWVNRTPASDSRWVSVVWAASLGLFVAVARSGTGNRVMTSVDGINWLSQVSANDNNWSSIAWSPSLSLLVAVAQDATSHQIMTSPNGTVWTQRTCPTANSLLAVTWNATTGQFVAVGPTGVADRIIVSSDGLTWTVQTNPTDQGWTAVAWSSTLGKYAATADPPTLSPDGSATPLANRVMLSGATVTVPFWAGAQAPTITSVTQGILTGTNLSPGATLTINGIAAVLTVTSSTTATFTAGYDVHDTVVLTNPDGQTATFGPGGGLGGGFAGGGSCNVCTTLAQAVTLLAARLEDASKVHWIDAELQRYLIEAIRTWNALTSYERAQEAFTGVANQAFYDLPTVIAAVRAYTVTDAYLMTDLEYALMEPATPTVWTGSEQFTFNDLLNALEQRRDLFLLETGIVQYRTTQAVASPPANGRILLTSTWITLRRLAWIDNASIVTPLHRDDEWAFNAFNIGWPSQSGDPTVAPPVAYSVGVTPPFTVQLAPPIATGGTLDIVGVARAAVNGSGPCLDPTVGILMGIPDDWTWVVKFGALADLFSQQGLAYDRTRAEYCEARWKHGIALATKSSVVLAARINDVPVQMPSLSDADCFDRNWQTTPGSPLSVMLAGTNLVVLNPPPSGSTDTVTLDVVRNMPIPATTVDCLGVEGWILDVVLDYAMHLALVKEGPQQLSDSLPLLDRFMRLAGVTEKLDQAAVPNRGPIFQQTAQSERVLSRVEPVEAA